MARKPSEPSPKSTGSTSVGDGRPVEQQVPVDARAQIAHDEARAADEQAAPTETVGPVAITRLRKADGRALILYSATGDRA
jgi:hypothetical protein